jgi:AbrB family looped-hinge helix DNA binding protein
MNHFKFYSAATIGSKGQIVIPMEARDELNMKEGDKVVIVKAPHHDGVLIYKAEILEKHLASVQEQLKNQEEA